MLIQVVSDELVSKLNGRNLFSSPKTLGVFQKFPSKREKIHLGSISSSYPLHGVSSRLSGWIPAKPRINDSMVFCNNKKSCPTSFKNQPKNGSNQTNGSENGKRCGKKKLQGLDVSQQQTFGIQKQQSSEGTSLVPWIGYEEKEGKFLRVRKIKKWWVGDRFKFEALKQKLAHETSKNRLKLVTLWTQSSISVRKNLLVVFWLCQFFRVSESKIRGSLGHCQVNESSEVTAGDATIRKFG